MSNQNYGSLVSESKYFNAPEEKRKKFKHNFFWESHKNPHLVLPYKNFDIAKSRNKGIERQAKTEDRVARANKILEFEIKSQKSFPEEKLFLKKNQENLKRIELIEIAHKIQKKNTSYRKARFNQLNRELYGSVNKKMPDFQTEI